MEIMYTFNIHEEFQLSNIMQYILTIGVALSFIKKEGNIILRRSVSNE